MLKLTHIVLTSHTSNVMLNIFQSSLQQYWAKKWQIFKLGFKQAEEPEIKLKTFLGSGRKQGNSKRTFTFLDHTKTFDCVDHKKLWKNLKGMEVPETLPVSWDICIGVKN